MATVLNRDPAPPLRSRAYQVDISRGSRIGRVASKWFSRADDERYLSLTRLHAAVAARARRATTRTAETRAFRVEAARDNAERLALVVPGRDEPVAPTHWSCGQLCGLIGAPSGNLRQLPAPLAGISLQHGLLSHRAELMKTLETEDGPVRRVHPDIMQLRRRLDTVPERERQVFDPERYRNTDYPVIATELGMTVAEVEQLMARAMRHLLADGR